MKKLLIYLSFLLVARGQVKPNSSVVQAVNNIFNTTYYEEVTQKTLKSFGALQKCGENDRQGKDVCVPYYNCDPNTKTVIQTGVYDGVNSIDIRYDDGENQCDHYLDVCCQIPQDNSSSFTSTTQRTGSFSHTTSEGAFTSRPISNTERTTRTTRTTTRSTTRRPISTDDRPNEVEGDNWSECGVRNVNGIDFTLQGNLNNVAQYGEFPWQVALLKTNYSETKHGKTQCICGGSLIRPNVVLTAAHCLSVFPAPEITVRAGEWDTQTTKERIPYQERLAVRTIQHERYGDGAINDIGLVVLNRPFTKVKSIGLVCLPKTNQRIDAPNCLATGWGKDNFGRQGAYSVILKKIELPIVANTRCQNLLRETRLGPHFKLHQSFTCAGGEAGKDTCTGDGGGPLVCRDQENPTRYVQSGIVSWGVGCGQQDVPGVYTDVAKMRSWIDRKLREIEN